MVLFSESAFRPAKHRDSLVHRIIRHSDLDHQDPNHIRDSNVSDQFFERGTITNFNLPSTDHREEDENKFLGATWQETISINKEWTQRVLRFILFFGVGVGIYMHLEQWDFQTASYFIAQTISTVGYGNLVPQSTAGLMLVAFYIVPGIIITFSVLGDFTRFFLKIIRNFYDNTHQLRLKRRLSRTQLIIRSSINLMMWCVFLLLLVLFGAMVLGINEGWTFVQAFFFATITVTSVGYGNFTPVKSSSIWFDIFYILVGVSLSSVCLEKIASFKRHIDEAELEQILQDIHLSYDLLDAIDKSGSRRVSRAEFVLHMLQLSGKLDPLYIIPWVERFQEFKEGAGSSGEGGGGGGGGQEGVLTAMDVINYEKKWKEYEAAMAAAATAAVQQQAAGQGQKGEAKDEEGEDKEGEADADEEQARDKPRISTFSAANSQGGQGRARGSTTSSSASSAVQQPSPPISTMQTPQRKKSLLLQFTEEARDVFLETLRLNKDANTTNTTTVDNSRPSRVEDSNNKSSIDRLSFSSAGSSNNGSSNSKKAAGDDLSHIQEVVQSPMQQAQKLRRASTMKLQEFQQQQHTAATVPTKKNRRTTVDFMIATTAPSTTASTASTVAAPPPPPPPPPPNASDNTTPSSPSIIHNNIVEMTSVDNDRGSSSSSSSLSHRTVSVRLASGSGSSKGNQISQPTHDQTQSTITDTNAATSSVTTSTTTKEQTTSGLYVDI